MLSSVVVEIVGVVVNTVHAADELKDAIERDEEVE